MGSLVQGCTSYLGGTSSALHQGSVHQEREDNGLDIPEEYLAEAIIYPAISKGYVTLQGLADGSISMQTLMYANRLVEFEHWLKKKAMKNSKKEEVEYFE